MRQALRLLESERQELQARTERLQEDKDLCSSDTQHLRGTRPLEASGSPEGGGWVGRGQSFICLVG